MTSKSALSVLCLAVILIVSHVGCFAPHVVAIHVGFLVMTTVGYSFRLALPLWFLAFMTSDLMLPPSARLEANLIGKVAVITGGSQGSGRGFAFGLTESGATVYITGRTLSSLKETCALAPGPGICIPNVVDSANDKALEIFFTKVANETGGRLDILVNNAYAGVGWWGKRKILGKPFWEQGMELYDAVTTVGVRSHYKATLLALPLLQRARDRGLIVNTNSAGCLMYLLNVPYGMGKCAIDKMTSSMAMELRTEEIDVVSWWSKEPMQTAEVKKGSLQGPSLDSNRGFLPGLKPLFPKNGFTEIFSTALSGTLFFEGRALSAFARDPNRRYSSGLAVQVSQLGQQYGLRDERGIRSPMLLSLKFLIFSLPSFLPFVRLANPPTLVGSPPTATPLQQFVFGTLPDFHIPTWVFKLMQGNPVTFGWPL